MTTRSDEASLRKVAIPIAVCFTFALAMAKLYFDHNSLRSLFYYFLLILTFTQVYSLVWNVVSLSTNRRSAFSYFRYGPEISKYEKCLGTTGTLLGTAAMLAIFVLALIISDFDPSSPNYPRGSSL